jgi:hypothetical protein
VSDDYDVGYGRPPKHSQWKKGQSGNKRGRPKGAESLRSILEDEQNELVTITENGVQKRITKMRVAVKAAWAKAMKGDARALSQLKAWYAEAGSSPFYPANGDYEFDVTVVFDEEERIRVIGPLNE